MGYTDQALLTFLGDVDSGKRSINDMGDYIQNASKSTSKFSSTLKNVGGTILSSLANVGIGMAIGLAVNGIVSLIDYLVVTKKEIKEMAQAAQSNIDTVRSDFDNLSSTVESVGDTYARLRQGVEQTNSEIKNIDLSQSDYEEFLSVSNQIAELSPELISGYDAQGNAILNLKGDYDSIISSLDTFIEKQRESMNLEIAENLPDLFKGVKQDSDDYLKEIDEYSQHISSLKEAYSSLNDPGFLENFENGILQFQEQDSHKFSLLATEYNELLKSLGLNQYVNGNVAPTNLEKGSYFVDFSSAPKEEIQRAMSELSSIAAEYQVQIGDLTDQVQQTTQKNAENWASLKDEMFAALSVDDSYKILSDQAKSDVQSIINNMDWGSLISNNDISEWSDLESWINDNVLSLFSGNNADSIQQAIAKAFDLQDALKSGEKSIGEYQKEISSIFDSFDDLDDATKDAIKVSLEFTGEDGSDLDTMVNNVKGKLSDEFDGMVDSMSYDDLVFAYQIENTGDMTWDELMAKIDQAYKIAENEIDIESRINLEGWENAQETGSYRSDYDQYIEMMNQTKELFEAGEIGDERFKAGARAFSKNAMDDAVNWQENYAALNKYFTEGSTGLETFVQDMSQLKDSSGEYFATWDNGANAWRLNLADMVDLADQLQMPLEMLSVLLEGLQQYGFTDDYFGTMEDGKAHFNDLIAELADKQAKLKDLQLNHPEDTTAISELENDIDGLNERINTTINGMQQLETMDVHELETQFEQGRDAIESVIEQYKQLEGLEKGSKTYEYVKEGLDAQVEALSSQYGIEIVFNSEGLPEIGRSIDEIEDDIAQAQAALDSLRNSDGTLNLDSTEVQQAQLDLKTALQEKQQLTQPAIMRVDASDVDGELGTAIAKLQEIQTLANEIEINKAIGLDTSQAESELSNLISEYNQLDGAKAINVELSADANVEQVQQAISEISVEDLTQVITGDNTAALKSVDDVVSYAASQVATIRVTAATSAAESAINNVARDRTSTVTVTTVNAGVKGAAGGATRLNGTAHAQGTVGHAMRMDNLRYNHPAVYKAYVGGDWGIPYDQTALVGEIGPELLVF